MSYSKDWRSFPPAFADLIEAGSTRQILVPCADAKDAKRLEGKLHAYFGVLHRSAVKNPEAIPLDNLSRRVRIKAVGAELLVGPRDSEPDNLRILAALGKEHTPDGVPMSADMQALISPDVSIFKD